jgi:hypothetical protein
LLRDRWPKSTEGFPVFATLAIVFFAVFVVSVLVAGIVYKKMKLEANLLDCWWKIEWDELQFYENKHVGRKSAVSLAMSDASFLSKSALLTSPSIAHEIPLQIPK